MNLLLASRNPHKTREFQQLLGKEFVFDDLQSLPEIQIAEETGRTFAENATLKAVGASKSSQSLVIADDSGLEVEALGGAPGVYSARYAGENASDADNITKLFRELKDVADRSARFRCVIVLAQRGKVRRMFEGVVEGQIVDLPRGANGFGYDPVFRPDGFQQTFAEMTEELKNRISHRAKAIGALREALRKIRS